MDFCAMTSDNTKIHIYKKQPCVPWLHPPWLVAIFVCWPEELLEGHDKIIEIPFLSRFLWEEVLLRLNPWEQSRRNN